MQGVAKILYLPFVHIMGHKFNNLISYDYNFYPNNKKLISNKKYLFINPNERLL
jgi:hypothetical protein